jgi:hypothetical protein
MLHPNFPPREPQCGPTPHWSRAPVQVNCPGSFLVGHAFFRRVSLWAPLKSVLVAAEL